MDSKFVVPRPEKKKLIFKDLHDVKRALRSTNLHSVCEEARCPNRSECFGRGTATFLAMGSVCTRACGFCSIATGRPNQLDPNEAANIVATAAKWNLKHVVVTSVDRDDLADGGSNHLYSILREIREKLPTTTNEILTPDFKGNMESLDRVLDADPDVFNHNLETVPSLYKRVRKGAQYERSLAIIQRAKQRNFITKTGVMLGVGESESELVQVFKDVHSRGADILTIGQYFQPTASQIPVEQYYAEAYFEHLAAIAKDIGIPFVYSGTFVRSSYNADEIFKLVKERRN